MISQTHLIPPPLTHLFHDHICSDSMGDFLTYLNVIWLFYHIFLVISMDWVFLEKSVEVAPIEAGGEVYERGYQNRNEAMTKGSEFSNTTQDSAL